MAYERLAALDPQNMHYHMALARIYIILVDRESARQELALLKEYYPEITENDISGAVENMESASSLLQAHGRLGIGFMYDTNANQGPSSNWLSLGSFDNLFISDIKEEKSAGSYVSAILDTGYRLHQQSPWWLVADMAAYRRDNFASGLHSNNHFTWSRVAMGGRYVGGNNLFDMRFKGEAGSQQHKSLDNQSFYGWGPEGTWVLSATDNFQFITRGSLERRDYHIFNGRNGQYWTVGEYLRLLLDDAGHNIMLGVRVLGSNVETHDYGYLGWETSLSFTARLPHDLEFIPYVVFKEESYNGPATALETNDRVDRQWRLGAALMWRFAKDWSLETGYQYVDTHSNSELYKYDQHIINMGIAWNF